MKIYEEKNIEIGEKIKFIFQNGTLHITFQCKRFNFAKNILLFSQFLIYHFFDKCIYLFHQLFVHEKQNDCQQIVQFNYYQTNHIHNINKKNDMPWFSSKEVCIKPYILTYKLVRIHIYYLNTSFVLIYNMNTTHHNLILGSLKVTKKFYTKRAN